MTRPAVRLALSAATALVTSCLVTAVLGPSRLEVETDIVGFPVFANFNIDAYFWAYGLVLAIPALTGGLYVFLTRVAEGRFNPWRPLPGPCARVESLGATASHKEAAVVAARTAFVGLVLGLEAAIVLDRASEAVLLVAVFYTLMSGTVAWFLARSTGRDVLRVVSMINVLAAPLLLAGLGIVSASTEVTILSSGETRSYSWLPLWLALLAAAALLGVLVRQLRRRARDDVRWLERCTTILVVAPVALFLFVSTLPGELGTFDAFEEGQGLAGAELVSEGAFPWRDIQLTHGFFHDVGQGLVGFALFEDSRWGLVAADGVLLHPLAWVGLYYLCAYLFWTNWLFLAGTQLLVVSEQVDVVQTRMLLVPVLLLLLAALLTKPTLLRAAGLVLVGAAQVIGTPEALAAGIPVALTLVLYELAYTRRGKGLTAGYPRLVRCAGVVVAVAAVWVAFLAAFGALGDWASSFVSTIPGHRYTGGIPTQVPARSWEVIAPVAAVLFAIAFAALRVWLRRPLSFGDWLMVAMAGYALLYFPKFLSRADSGHLAQSYSAAVPLLFYLGYRGVTYAESAFAARLSWLPSRHTITLPVLAALLLTAPLSLPEALRAAPGHFRAEVSTDPPLERIGYARAGENDLSVLEGLDGALAELNGPDETAFDFSNAPGVVHYLLDEATATPYYHVSYAIRGRDQADLVRRLRAERPGSVVFTSAGAGSQGFNSLPAWDGLINPVRHYDVSTYLLDEYVPVRDVGGFVVMTRRDRGAPADGDLYFRSGACDWGYVPSFFAPAPPPSAASMELPFRKIDPVGASGRAEHAVMISRDAARYRWLEVHTTPRSDEATFLLADRRNLVPHAARAIFFKVRAEPGTSVVRIPIGACPQWRGYEPGTLYLSTTGPQEIRALRLVERRDSVS